MIHLIVGRCRSQADSYLERSAAVSHPLDQFSKIGKSTATRNHDMTLVQAL